MNISLLKIYFFIYLLALFASKSLYANYEEQLMTELMLAEEGSIIEIPEGNFSFTLPLSLSVDHVTIRGQGMNKSILSFEKQIAGAEGFMITANNVTLENFSILDTKGDALKVVASRNIIIRNKRTA